MKCLAKPAVQLKPLLVSLLSNFAGSDMKNRGAWSILTLAALKMVDSVAGGPANAKLSQSC